MSDLKIGDQVQTGEKGDLKLFINFGKIITSKINKKPECFMHPKSHENWLKTLIGLKYFYFEN